MNPLEFITFTPGTNCGECGFPTCLAFAVAVTKGGTDPARCPYIDPAGVDGVQTEPSVEDGLEKVSRGQDERDLALVAHLKTKISGLDFKNLAPRIGADWNAEEPEKLNFTYLGQAVRISREEVCKNGDSLVDPRDQILLYNYISYGGGDAPGHDWVGMESLPNSISKVRTLSAYCEQPLAKRFSSRAERLAEICLQLNGVPGPEGQSATVGYVIPVLPRVPHYLLFWDEEPDDGFESRVKVLFDQHVLQFLDIESLVFAAERMAERILELDNKQ